MRLERCFNGLPLLPSSPCATAVHVPLPSLLVFLQGRSPLPSAHPLTASHTHNARGSNIEDIVHCNTSYASSFSRVDRRRHRPLSSISGRLSLAQTGDHPIPPFNAQQTDRQRSRNRQDAQPCTASAAASETICCQTGSSGDVARRCWR